MHSKTPTANNVFQDSSKESRDPTCSATFPPHAMATLSPTDVTIATGEEKQVRIYKEKKHGTLMGVVSE
jgi:hypothetical protein